MNILLLFPDDRCPGGTSSGLSDLYRIPRSDPRGNHIVKILKRSPGEELKAGLVNGPGGNARIQEITPEEIILSFLPRDEPGFRTSRRVALVVGQVRPICAKRILREAAMLGALSITFIGTDLGERSYGDAKLWKTGEAERYIIDGVVQSGTTRLPSLAFFPSVERFLAESEGSGCGSEELPDDDSHCLKLFLDNQVPARALSAMAAERSGELDRGLPTVIAVGSERGWSDRERRLFLDASWIPAGLGNRILRSETASAAALSLLLL